jgi:hypothetical protein
MMNGTRPLRTKRSSSYLGQSPPRTSLNLKGNSESWLGKFGQRDKWSFCLTAARMAAEQEKR